MGQSRTHLAYVGRCLASIPSDLWTSSQEALTLILLRKAGLEHCSVPGLPRNKTQDVGVVGVDLIDHTGLYRHDSTRPSCTSTLNGGCCKPWMLYSADSQSTSERQQILEDHILRSSYWRFCNRIRYCLDLHRCIYAYATQRWLDSLQSRSQSSRLLRSGPIASRDHR